jgi:hypothetical protein
VGYTSGGASYVAGSDTSEAAAVAITPKAEGLRLLVYRHIWRNGSYGATCCEVELALEMRHQTASARIRELYLSDDVRDSGRRRRTTSGRNAVVWVANRLPHGAASAVGAR